MKKILLTISLIIIMLMATSSFCYAADIIASGDCSMTESYYSNVVNNVTWELNSEGVLTIAGTGYMKNYEQGELTPWVGYKDKIKKIVVKTGVLSVGEYAFYECSSLTDLVVEEGVKELEHYSFQNCKKLKNVTLPSTIMHLEYDTFDGCTSVTNCYLADLTGWMQKDALLNNTSGSLPLGERDIANGKFGNIYVNGELVTDFEIPDGTVEIGSPYWNGNSYYLYGAAFDKLIVPTTLEKIELVGCYFDKVMISDLSSWCKVRRNCEHYFHYVNDLYLNDKKITDLIIPNDVSVIAQGAFYGFEGIKTVTIPETVTFIGDNAFENMPNAKITYKGSSSSAIENLWSFKTTNTKATSVTISWPKLTKATSYKVYVKESSGWKLKKTIKDPETSSYTITNLYNNNNAQVKIVAEVDGNKFTYEGQTYNTKPRKVENVKLTTGSKYVKASWDFASPYGYQVQIATNKNFTTGVKKYNVSDTARSKKITKLTKGKTYYVRVRAYNYKIGYPQTDNMKQYGSWSAVKSITCK